MGVRSMKQKIFCAYGGILFLDRTPYFVDQSISNRGKITGHQYGYSTAVIYDQRSNLIRIKNTMRDPFVCLPGNQYRTFHTDISATPAKF